MMQSIKTLLLCLTIVMFAVIPAAVLAQSPEEQVRAQVTEFNAAYERNELDAYFGYYADDATLWFNNGRVILADYRKDWYKLIADGGGVEKNVLSDVQIQMGPGDTTAVATYRLDVLTRMADGSVTTDKAHETDVWFKREGKWLISHIHYTVEAAELEAAP